MKNNKLPLVSARTYHNIASLPEVSRYQFIFWLLWPFGALIYALKNFREPSSKTLFWLFCVYFGFVFVFADPFGVGGADSARYAANLIELHSNPYSFTKLWSSLYNVNTNTADIYQPLVTWLVSLLTGNPAWLFALFAAVFGYFYTQNLWMVFSHVKVNVTLMLFMFMVSFALVNPLWNINGVRMWTAAQVFLYGNLLYFLNNNKRGLWWSVASVLFHFSFLFPVALLFLWQIVPRKAALLFGFYIGTAFISEIDLAEIRKLLTFLPDIFQSRVESYTNEAYAEAIELRKYSRHVTLAGIFYRWVTYVWIAIVFFHRNKWKNNSKTYEYLFLFALFVGGFANLAANVPSGGRFVVVSNGLFYATFILLLGKNYLHIPWLKWISLPFLAFVIIFKIRMGFDYMGFLTVAGNPFFAPFFDSQVPLIDFVKSVF